MGALRPGEQLPSIRELSERLRINRNTIAKVYSMLEQEGIVELRHGKGVFLLNGPAPFKAKVRNSIIDESIDSAIVQAWHLQLDRDAFLKRLEQRWNQLEKQQSKQKRKDQKNDRRQHTNNPRTQDQ